MSINIRVVSRDDGWAVQKEDGSDLLSHLSEDEAIDVGRELARLNRAVFLIYGNDGAIRERYSYEGLGHDLYP
jgi:hypothetical protein